MTQQAIKAYYDREIAAIQSLDLAALERAVQAIRDAYEREATIYVFGNGGSAATASHFCCDFNKGISDGHAKKFRLVCLSDNTATLMAIANDITYEEVFAYQLRGRLRPTDLVIAISGSGNSANVLRAVEYARSLGTPVVGICGYDGGRLRELADYPMHAAIDDMQIAEDIHMSFDHMMYRVFTEAMK